VLSVIEYTSSVWSPHYTADIGKVGRVKRKFIKLFLGCSKLSYAICRQTSQAKIGKSSVRRMRHDLILTHKILFGLTDMNHSLFHICWHRTHSTRNHAYKLLHGHCWV